MKTSDYLTLNRAVYDELAEEFREKIGIREENNNKILANFKKALNERFGKGEANVLEIGPGAGYLCKVLTENNYNVTAIEFSSKMAAICKKVAPKTNLIVDEFLSHDFGGKKFAGILAVALVHLFPSSETAIVLEKIRSLLGPNGIVYMGTTSSAKSEEGLRPKVNFRKKLLRFRRKFTRDEFEKELLSAGFKIIHAANYPDNEEENKVWMDYILEASKLTR